MKKLSVIFAAMALLALPLIVLSCSGDDNSNNDTTQISQAQAQQMQAMATTLAPMTGIVTSAGMTHVDGIEEGDYDLSEIFETGDGGTIIVEYLEESGWWDAFFSFETDPESDTAISLTLRDSVRFEDATGGAQEQPDETTNLMRNIATIALLADIAGLGDIDLEMHGDLTYSNLLSSSVTVNGAMSLDLETDLSFEDQSLSGTVVADLEINNLVIPKPSFEGEVTCPTSGEIVLTVSENLSAQAVNEGIKSVTWTLTVTVLDENTYRITLQGGGQNFGEVTVNNACTQTLSLGYPIIGPTAAFMKSAAPQK